MSQFLPMGMELTRSELNEPVHVMEPLESGHLGGGSECEICNSQGYSFAGVPTEEGTEGECLPVCQCLT